jgi:hypothetical protein
MICPPLFNGNFSISKRKPTERFSLSELRSLLISDAKVLKNHKAMAYMGIKQKPSPTVHFLPLGRSRPLTVDQG